MQRLKVDFSGKLSIILSCFFFRHGPDFCPDFSDIALILPWFFIIKHALIFFQTNVASMSQTYSYVYFNFALGSRLCTTADIKYRCNRGNHAFQEYKKVWLQGPKISLVTKIKIYESLVTSVILYNSNSWATCKKTLNKLDVCQRKHLRQIVSMQWPGLPACLNLLKFA